VHPPRARARGLVVSPDRVLSEARDRALETANASTSRIIVRYGRRHTSPGRPRRGALSRPGR
jgi:hypothetical protein